MENLQSVMQVDGQIHFERLQTLSKAKRFLGKEFLLWLWYVSETKNGNLVITDRRSGHDLEVDFWLEDRLVLESISNCNYVTMLKGNQSSQTMEANAGLAGGRTVRQLRLGMMLAGVGEYKLTLDADDLGPSAVRIPKRQTENEVNRTFKFDSPIEHRLFFLEFLLVILDGLFAAFIASRVDETWATTEAEKIRAWTRTRAASTDAQRGYDIVH